MKETQSPVVTPEMLNMSLSAVEERMTNRMMQGFEALDMKIDFVESKMDRGFSDLSAQILHLAATKADWPEIA